MQNSYERQGRGRADLAVSVAWPMHLCSLEDKFHHAVLSGRLNKIRDYVRKGIAVDSFNQDGQTALFCAAFKGISSVVALLLSLGAKPNGRCQPDGYTAVHGACYSGCTQTVKLILQAGGDLRLCDNQKRTPVCWCLLQPDPVRLQAIRNVIEGARICVMQTDGVEMLKEMHHSLSPRSNKVFFETVRNMLKMSSRNGSDMNLNLEELSSGIHNTGFGKVYFGSGQKCASVIGLPYISEVDEMEDEDDQEAPAWVCGRFTAFHPRRWIQRRTSVSTRELYKMAGPHCIPDILITELEVRSKLHHPNLLMLLGVCQTNKCDSVTLVFERIQIGSLYSVLHTSKRKIRNAFPTDIVIQICEALEYVHSMGIVHCAVTSHAVMLVNSGQAKLSCFEYALPDDVRSQECMSWRHPILTSDAHLSVLRHWMAPEVLLKQQFSVEGDIYSLLCIMWELCSGEIPWCHYSLQGLRQLFSKTRERLCPNKSKMPSFWYPLLDLGLAVKKDDRDVDLQEIKDMMVLSKRPQSVQNSEMGSQYDYRRISTTSAGSLSTQLCGLQTIDDVDDDIDIVDCCGTNGPVHRKSSFLSPATHSRPTEILPAQGILKKYQVKKQIPITANKATCTIELEAEDPEPKAAPKTFKEKLNMFDNVSENCDVIITANKATCTTELEAEDPEPKAARKTFEETLNMFDDVSENCDVTITANKATCTTEPEAEDSEPKAARKTFEEKLNMFDNVSDNCEVTITANKATCTTELEAEDPEPKEARKTFEEKLNMFDNVSENCDVTITANKASCAPELESENPETKAARKAFKEKLTRIFELSYDGMGYHVDESRRFFSLQHPRKASAIKPASHCQEGITLDAFGSGELWNHIPIPASSTTLPITGAGDKPQSPAIKPAGHSLSM